MNNPYGLTIVYSLHDQSTGGPRLPRPGQGEAGER